MQGLLDPSCAWQMPLLLLLNRISRSKWLLGKICSPEQDSGFIFQQGMRSPWTLKAAFSANPSAARLKYITV